jgi:nicotinamidase-related amidase
MMSSEREQKFFKSRGFGRTLGFGERPAVVVVDLINGFTRREMPLGSDLDSEIEATVKLLQAARAVSLPIFFTTAYYEEDLADAGVWQRKTPNLATLKRGTNAVELDARLKRRDHEAVIVKKYASAFFGTDLASRLTSQRVDTVVLAGCTTSGCVRATAVDALQSGFIPVVVREAVGDRSERAHEQSLFDLGQKYADVVDLNSALEHLAHARRAVETLTAGSSA